MGRCHHEAMLPEQLERRPWLVTVALLLGLSAAAILIAVALAHHSVPTAKPTPPTQPPAPSTAVTPPVAAEHLSGPMPSPREFTAMAYDALHREIVLFGGYVWSVSANTGSTVSDTWTFQGRSWSKHDPMTSPGPLANDLMIYDDTSLTCLLVGKSISAVGPGGPAETWSWNGSSWARLPDIPLGTNEVIQGFAFDRTHGEAVLLTWASAGNGPLTTTHTWTWNGRSWALRHPLHELPVGGAAPRLATVGPDTPARPGRGVLAVFEDSATATETWLWDGSTWSEQAATASPPYDPLGATMADDPVTGVVVLIGLEGVGSNAAGSSSTWLWDGASWHRAGVAPDVDSLYGGTWLLSDGSTGHVVVIGDSGRPNRFDVLWSFGGHAWVSDGSV